MFLEFRVILCFLFLDLRMCPFHHIIHFKDTATAFSFTDTNYETCRSLGDQWKAPGLTLFFFPFQFLLAPPVFQGFVCVPQISLTSLPARHCAGFCFLFFFFFSHLNIQGKTENSNNLRKIPVALLQDTQVSSAIKSVCKHTVCYWSTVNCAMSRVLVINHHCAKQCTMCSQKGVSVRSLSLNKHGLFFSLAYKPVGKTRNLMTSLVTITTAQLQCHAHQIRFHMNP